MSSVGLGALVVSQSVVGQNVGSGQEGMSKSSRLLVRQGATSQATTLQVRVHAFGGGYL